MRPRFTTPRPIFALALYALGCRGSSEAGGEPTPEPAPVDAPAENEARPPGSEAPPAAADGADVIDPGETPRPAEAEVHHEHCPQGGCTQECEPKKRCRLSCEADKCTQRCRGGLCSAGCSEGGCDQICESDLETCRLSCPGGGCTQTCKAGPQCQLSCSGGGCTQTCEPGSSCALDCAGKPGCEQACDGAKACDKK